jgi:hypothetical protein
MRSPTQALVWEVWAGHRRNWLTIAAVFIAHSIFYRLLAGRIRESDALQSLSVIPAILTLGLMMAIFNFTESNPRKGYSGFPHRLFTMPVGAWFLVAVPMLCGLLSVVMLYLAWAELVFRPVGIEMLLRWPATLLAAAVVFYQAIVWCMSGFRITRLFALGFVFANLVAVGFAPYMPQSIRGSWTEGKLTTLLVCLMLIAYAAAVIAVGHQRRGGELGWAWPGKLWQGLMNAIPHRTWKLSSANRAMLWMEWRRSGIVLPLAVLFISVMILSQFGGFSGHDAHASARRLVWLLLSPTLLAIPIGRGIAKPDFWSLELSLSPFLSTRPITNAQIVATKLKSAGLSTLLAYGIVLVAAAVWATTGDPEHLRDLWTSFRVIYSPISQWVISGFAIAATLLLTWTLLIGSLWLGYSGRPWFFYGGVVIGIVALVGSLIAIVVCCDLSDSESQFILQLLRWVPWLLAAAFILKCWTAIGVFCQARHWELISQRSMVRNLVFWAGGTLGFVALAWFISPRVEWLRYTLYLAALLAVPLVRVQAATLALAWNRHR